MQVSRVPGFLAHSPEMYRVPVYPMGTGSQWLPQQPGTTPMLPVLHASSTTRQAVPHMTWPLYQQKTPNSVSSREVSNKSSLKGSSPKVTSSPALSHISSDSGIHSRSPSPSGSCFSTPQSNPDSTCQSNTSSAPQSNTSSASSKPRPASDGRRYPQLSHHPDAQQKTPGSGDLLNKCGASPLLASSTNYSIKHRVAEEVSPSVQKQRKGLKRKLSVCSTGSLESEKSPARRGCSAGDGGDEDESHDSLLEEPRPKYMRPWEETNSNNNSSSVTECLNKSSKNIKKENTEGDSLSKPQVSSKAVTDQSQPLQKPTSKSDTKVIKKVMPTAKASPTTTNEGKKTQQYQQDKAIMSQMWHKQHPHHQQTQQQQSYTQGFPYVSPYMAQLNGYTGLSSAFQQQYNAAMQAAAAANHGYGFQGTTQQYHHRGFHQGMLSGNLGNLVSGGAVPSVQDLMASSDDFLTKGRLNAKATQVLNDWYAKNATDPYPTNVEAKRIAQEGGISMAQVRKWMANKRVRSGNTVKVNKSLKCKQGIKQTD